MKVRRISAIVFLAMNVAWLAACLIGEIRDPYGSRSPLHHCHAWVPQLQMGLALAVGLAAALGVACSWWWARLLSVSLALAQLFPAVMRVVADGRFPIYWYDSAPIAWAAALLACLHGPAVRGLYEGRHAGADWQARGMLPLWWAIVLNGMTLVRLPPWFIEAWQHYWSCWKTYHPTIDPKASGYWPSVVLAPLLLAGLGLLARRKTAGLLLTAAASVVLPFAVMASLREPFSAGELWRLALIPVPGVLAALLALGLWARPMWRSLFGDRTIPGRSAPSTIEGRP
jgi:hypothetical protein